MGIKDSFDLTGKTAVVTGGSIGLGAQMAAGLAEAGANLVIAARKVERCVELCAKLEENGIRAIAVACDVSDAASCQNLVDITVRNSVHLTFWSTMPVIPGEQMP
jgi:gluconate 5-dehydrogenase